MSDLNIKPTHKPIKNYYIELERYAQLGEENEGTVRAAFQTLLQHYCGQSDLTLLCEKSRYTPEKRRITPDGEVVDAFGLREFGRKAQAFRLRDISPLSACVKKINLTFTYKCGISRISRWGHFQACCKACLSLTYLGRRLKTRYAIYHENL